MIAQLIYTVVNYGGVFPGGDEAGVIYIFVCGVFVAEW